MIFRCTDVETTGLPDDPEARTGMMELGWCDLRYGDISAPKSMLVDCGIPVTIGARAIHHISDEMVAGEPGPDEACMTLNTGDHEYLCAHNIDHEKNYVAPGSRPDPDGGEPFDRKWICTYKTTLRIWPEAPGHKLQDLRYWLKLDDEPDFNPKFADPPHRAPADAYVCAHLLRRILKWVEAESVNDDKISIDRLVKWSSGPALLYMCFMKKHKNKPWHQVAIDDRPYLDWIFNQSDVKDRDIRATVKYWLARTAAPADGDTHDRYPTP